MLDAGDPAPDFGLPSAADPEARYRLSAAVDAGPAVLAFVPPGAERARRLLVTLEAIDWPLLVDRIAVFAIASTGPVADQLADRGYPFPVLVDESGYVQELYGLSTRDGPADGRALVVVDRRCTIRYAWAAADAGEAVPRSDLTGAVRSLGSG
jgi:peroxiredoxin